MSLSEATQGSDTSATEWFTINGVLGGDDLGQFVSPLQVKTWRQMSTFAEREGFHGFQNTSRVLQCWLYYGATVNGWGSGLDHVRWERLFLEFVGHMHLASGRLMSSVQAPSPWMPTQILNRNPLM
ncbi:hypothetical protein N7527_004642 [Penicillium freii]|nr:hypothetical protein N7527_004642 [Penicillium freii]